MARTTTPPRFYAMSQLAFLDRDVSQFGWSAVSPSRSALSQSAARTGRQAKRTAARSHAQPSLCGEHGEHGEHWTLMAGARGAKLDQAGCVRTSASASRPLYGAREAEAGGPSKSVTATPSISVILLRWPFPGRKEARIKSCSFIGSKQKRRMAIGKSCSVSWVGSRQFSRSTASQKVLPMHPPQPERCSHDHTGQGTKSLFAALDVATGKITGQCYPSTGHKSSMRSKRGAAGFRDASGLGQPCHA